MATTEGSLPITALLYDFEFSDPLVLDAENDLALEGDVYTEFSIFLDDMILVAGIFLVVRGIFPNTCGMSFWKVFVDRYGFSRIPVVCLFRRYLMTGMV